MLQYMCDLYILHILIDRKRDRNRLTSNTQKSALYSVYTNWNSKKNWIKRT